MKKTSFGISWIVLALGLGMASAWAEPVAPAGNELGDEVECKSKVEKSGLKVLSEEDRIPQGSVDESTKTAAPGH